MQMTNFVKKLPVICKSAKIDSPARRVNGSEDKIIIMISYIYNLNKISFTMAWLLLSVCGETNRAARKGGENQISKSSE
jgi:hypothetical protein